MSSSVARLSAENVTVVDSNGKMLAGANDPSSFGSLSSDQLDYQARVEKGLENRVRTMLESALGENKAIVRLSCSFDFKKQERTEELYLPDNKVVRSEQVLNEITSEPGKTPRGYQASAPICRVTVLPFNKTGHWKVIQHLKKKIIPSITKSVRLSVT